MSTTSSLITRTLVGGTIGVFIGFSLISGAASATGDQRMRTGLATLIFMYIGAALGSNTAIWSKVRKWEEPGSFWAGLAAAALAAGLFFLSAMWLFQYNLFQAMAVQIVLCGLATLLGFHLSGLKQGKTIPTHQDEPLAPVQAPAQGTISLLITLVLMLCAIVAGSTASNLFFFHLGASLGSIPGGPNANFIVLYTAVYSSYIGNVVGSALGVWTVAYLRHWRGSFWAALGGAMLCTIGAITLLPGQLFTELGSTEQWLMLLSGLGALAGFGLSRLRSKHQRPLSPR